MLGYTSRGTMKALTSYFSIPKRNDDIRIIYDSTKSGLYAQLWTPWFALPTIKQH